MVENRNIEEIVKELEAKMSKAKLNINLVKMKDELNELIILAKDPKRMYDTEVDINMGMGIGIGIEEQLIETEKNRPKINLSTLKPIGIKLPNLKEDARIMIKKDTALMIKAGGYSYSKAYDDLSRYAEIGFI